MLTVVSPLTAAGAVVAGFQGLNCPKTLARRGPIREEARITERMKKRKAL